jgi:hypothetical protein
MLRWKEIRSTAIRSRLLVAINSNTKRSANEKEKALSIKNLHKYHQLATKQALLIFDEA